MNKSISQLFSDFKKQKIHYAFLRNESLHQASEPKGDIDIYISSTDFKKAKKVFEDNNYYCRFLSTIPGHGVFTTYDKSNLCFITVDVQIGGLSHDGLLYFPEEVLHEGIKNEKLKSSHKAATLLLHSLIDKGYIKKRYKEEINNVLKTNSGKTQVRTLLSHVFSQKHIDKILQHYKHDDLRSLKKYTFLYLIFSNKNNLRRYLQTQIQRIRKITKASWRGSLIVFIGPDGSGKSSTSIKLKELLSNATIRNKLVYMGWRNGMIPFIPKLMKVDQIMYKEKRKNTVHTGFLSIIRSILISLLYYTEMLLRYFRYIFIPRILGRTILTDRYFFDRLALDTTLPVFAKVLLSKLTPKPDLTFYFYATSKTLATREKNLSEASLQKQLDKYNAYFKETKCVKIDTNKYNKKQALALVCQEIWKYRNFT